VVKQIFVGNSIKSGGDIASAGGQKKKKNGRVRRPEIFVKVKKALRHKRANEKEKEVTGLGWAKGKKGSPAGEFEQEKIARNGKAEQPQTGMKGKSSREIFSGKWGGNRRTCEKHQNKNTKKKTKKTKQKKKLRAKNRLGGGTQGKILSLVGKGRGVFPEFKTRRAGRRFDRPREWDGNIGSFEKGDRGCRK